MERVFGESELHWTIVRPPRLTDKPYTGKYQCTDGHLPRFGFTISRADVGECVIKTVEDRAPVER